MRPRATNGRSSLLPEGNAGKQLVRDGTLMATGVCLLRILLASRGVRFFVEQPGQSCFDDQPRFHDLCSKVRAAWPVTSNARHSAVQPISMLVS